MILFVCNDISIVNDWLDSNLEKGLRKRLFPEAGQYMIYVVVRTYASIPLIADVSDCVSQYIAQGTIIEYIVK